MTRQLTIAIADDEPDLREYLQKLLTRCGHRVFAACNGQELVSLCTICHPNVVITDWRMPMMDGLTAASQISQARAVPVIVMSASAETQSEARARRVPVMAWLRKPLRANEVQSTIEDLETGGAIMSDHNPAPGVFGIHPFLAALGERQRMMLAAGAKPFTAAAGMVLAQQGMQADTFYLIESGHVALSANGFLGQEMPITMVGPGEIIGWSWLIPPHVWQFNCRAEDEVRGIAFNTEWLRDLCERDYSLGYAVLRQLVAVMASRLTATRHQLCTMSGHAVATGHSPSPSRL